MKPVIAKMMFVLVLLLAIAGGVLAFWVSIGQTSMKSAVVTLPDGASIVADVADTALLQEKGLSGRAHLDPNAGMLFVFDGPSTPTFWMPDMHFPLDMIWIRGNTVVSIDEDVPVEPGIPVARYHPTGPVDRVLEVNAGGSKAHGLGAGSILDIRLGKQ